MCVRSVFVVELWDDAGYSPAVERAKLDAVQARNLLK